LRPASRWARDESPSRRHTGRTALSALGDLDMQDKNMLGNLPALAFVFAVGAISFLGLYGITVA